MSNNDVNVIELISSLNRLVSVWDLQKENVGHVLWVKGMVHGYFALSHIGI